ncbi:MAG: ArsB/NhaD family transporter [Nitrososphaerota archaeon]|nr:ArsB/NhaD family transporter [Nitrososphaerota archaeon]
MLAFVSTIILIFKRPSFRIPFTSKRLQIDYGSAPLLCALALLATPSLPALTLLREGIFGCSYIRPYSVVILILSLSYICISLDCTGFFKYISLYIVKVAGSSGMRLFIYLFLLTSFLTMFTSNDVVILTITYIVLYICTYAGVDPIPYLLAQFFAANILSMGLYVGNPTNIVIADAFGITFIEFARWMLLPAVLASLTCLTLLILIFKRRIPRRIKIPNINPQDSLEDRGGAIFGLLMLGGMLFLISLPTEWTDAQPWIIALSTALIMVSYDLLFRSSRTGMVIRSMPWKIAPFLIGLLIIIETLSFSGWTNFLATQISYSLSREPVISIFGLSFISALGAGLMNNHTMTVFFVKTIKESLALQFSERDQIVSTFALVIGSNLGANYMLTGSLAGLMWSKILSDKGVEISFSKFSKYGFMIMPVVMLATSLSLTVMLMLNLSNGILL